VSNKAQPDATERAALADALGRQSAIDLILAGNSIPQVAVRLGVHRTTVFRWTRDAAFVAELRRLRAARRYALHEQMQDLATVAIRTLGQIMTDEEAPYGDRVRACATILDRAGITAACAHDGPHPRPRAVDGVEDWPEQERQLAEDKKASAALAALFAGD
jgi:hypothetical protein